MLEQQNNSELDSVVLTIMFIILGLAVIISYIYFGFSFMRLFKKAGEKNTWAAWVPFYNQWKMFEVAGRPGWWSLLGTALGLISLVVPFFYFLAYILNIVIGVIFNIDLAKSFGKSGGYAAALIFLPIPMYLLLALGNDKYIGPRGVASSGVSDDNIMAKSIDSSNTVINNK